MIGAEYREPHYPAKTYARNVCNMVDITAFINGHSLDNNEHDVQ